MPDVRDHIPDETVRILARRARELERLNPHIPASQQIADRLAADLKRRMGKRRRPHGSLLYAAIVILAQVGLVAWLVSNP